MKLFYHDPREPIKSLNFHLKCLKIWGLWYPEETERQNRYKIFAVFCQFFCLYFFVFTQALHLADIKDVGDLADSMYFFLIQLVLIPKLFLFLKHNKRIKNMIKQLENPLFKSQNESEDTYIQYAIFRSLIFHRVVLCLCYSCIVMWSLSPFIPSSGKTYMIPAAFPWPAQRGIGYAVAYVYQWIAISHSAFTHMTTDTLATGLFFHVAAQTHILGLRISKIGHCVENTKTDRFFQKTIAVQPVKQSTNECYNEILDCIKHHYQILEFKTELQNIFKESMFFQICTTLFCLCMTEFCLVNFGSVLLFLNIFPYFCVITLQIWQVCYTGNEVLFASKTLMERAYFSNFLHFDTKTRKLLILLMERFKRDITIQAESLFKIPLNIVTFTSIMRGSYSYFALLQSVQNHE